MRRQRLCRPALARFGSRRLPVVEVRENGKREFGGPCVAAELQRRVGLSFNRTEGFFGFEEELRCAANAEAVIRDALLGFLGRFVDNVFKRFRVAEVVVYVPAKRLEEGVKELAAQFGLVVAIGAEIIGISPEVPHHADLRRMPHFVSSWQVTT